MPPLDLSVLKADMHSHLIPGIDDGAPNMDVSLDLITGLKEHGFEHIITTPHVMSDYYRNTSDIIKNGRDQVLEALDKKGIQIGFEAAAEYFLDEHFLELISKKDLLTFGDDYVLFELRFVASPPMLKKALFELQMAGYQPILAHPERYTYWHKDLDKFRELHERDIMLQLNINSLTGTYSPQVQKCGEQLIMEGLVDFVGTDTHHAGHLELMNQAKTSKHLHDLVAKGKIKNPSLVK